MNVSALKELFEEVLFIKQEIYKIKEGISANKHELSYFETELQKTLDKIKEL